MNRRSFPRVLALAVAVASGCSVDHRGAVALTRLCFPPTPGADGSCTLAATCDQVLASGRLFVDLATSGGTLLYPIQIDNQRLATSDSETGRVDTAQAFVERFEMRYEMQGLSFPNAFANQAVSVPTGGSTVAMVRLIPPGAFVPTSGAVPAGPTSAIIHVKAHGTYGDNQSFETAEYSVPVDVSVGVVGGFGCPAGQSLAAVCPQDGQTASVLCQ
jgi:hypothetical protein